MTSDDYSEDTKHRKLRIPSVLHVAPIGPYHLRSFAVPVILRLFVNEPCGAGAGLMLSLNEPRQRRRRKSMWRDAKDTAFLFRERGMIALQIYWLQDTDMNQE